MVRERLERIRPGEGGEEQDGSGLSFSDGGGAWPRGAGGFLSVVLYRLLSYGVGVSGWRGGSRSRRPVVEK